MPGSKVAVFPFAGDDGETIHRQVLHVLRAKGMKPNTGLKPMFDTPEQYRETAATLGLAAYVDGEVTVDGGEASATIHLRSGASGLRLWSGTFTGERRQLANDVGKRLGKTGRPPSARPAPMRRSPVNRTASRCESTPARRSPTVPLDPSEVSAEPQSYYRRR